MKMSIRESYDIKMLLGGGSMYQAMYHFSNIIYDNIKQMIHSPNGQEYFIKRIYVKLILQNKLRPAG